MGETEIQSGKITLGLITSWGLGALFLVAGVAAFTDSALIGAAVPFLIVAVILLPPIRSFVYRKTGKTLSTGVRVVLVLIFLSVATVAASPDANLSASAEHIEETAQSTPPQPLDDTATTQPQNPVLAKGMPDDIKMTIMERCKTDAGEYGAALVKACVDQDIKAYTALQTYPSENAAVIDRCKMDGVDYGWSIVKACVDQDVKAQKALADY